MSVPDVSIVVVAHDVRDEVLRCLASVETHAAPVTYETSWSLRLQLSHTLSFFRAVPKLPS